MWPMSTQITIAQDFKAWRKDMVSLPDTLKTGQAEKLYDGRNKIWLLSRGEVKYVVKCFHPLGFIKGVIYTFFRKNKAIRAFQNGILLESKGVKTPKPIALIEQKRLGLYRKLYYVSTFTDWLPIRKPLTEDSPFNKLMTIDYAHFVATLHEKGIIHKDLNNTNVLYHLNGQHYEFMLIDINRMTFTSDGNAAPYEDCLENLTLFADRGEMFDTFAAEYIKARGWDASHIADVFNAKAKHDRHWQRKKKLKSLIHRHHGE